MLETPRLKLRLHEKSDFAALKRMWGHPEVVRFIGGEPNPPSDVWRRLMFYRGHWVLEGFGFWVVEERGSGDFVGELGFAHFERGMAETDGAIEAGWCLSPEHFGKGYATEAMQCATKWFETSRAPERTVCIIETKNAPSLRLARRLGYVRFGESTLKGCGVELLERLPSVGRS